MQLFGSNLLYFFAIRPIGLATKNHIVNDGGQSPFYGFLVVNFESHGPDI